MRINPGKRTYITAEYLTRARIERICERVSFDREESTGGFSAGLHYHPSATVRLLSKLIDCGLLEKSKHGHYRFNRRLRKCEGMRLYLPFLDTSPNHIWVEDQTGTLMLHWCAYENGVVTLQEWGSFSKSYGMIKFHMEAGAKKSWLSRNLYRMSNWLESWFNGNR